MSTVVGPVRDLSAAETRSAIPHWAFPAHIVVEASDDHTVFEQNYRTRAALAQELYAFFTCTRVDCPPGDYVASITGEGGGSVERLAFRIEARP